MKLRSESDLGRDGDGRTSLLSLSVPPFPPTRSVTDPINPVSESRVSSRPLLRARAPPSIHDKRKSTPFCSSNRLPIHAETHQYHSAAIEMIGTGYPNLFCSPDGDQTSLLSSTSVGLSDFAGMHMNFTLLVTHFQASI